MAFTGYNFNPDTQLNVVSFQPSYVEGGKGPTPMCSVTSVNFTNLVCHLTAEAGGTLGCQSACGIRLFCALSIASGGYPPEAHHHRGERRLCGAREDVIYDCLNPHGPRTITVLGSMFDTVTLANNDIFFADSDLRKVQAPTCTSTQWGENVTSEVGSLVCTYTFPEGDAARGDHWTIGLSVHYDSLALSTVTTHFEVKAGSYNQLLAAGLQRNHDGHTSKSRATIIVVIAAVSVVVILLGVGIATYIRKYYNVVLYRKPPSPVGIEMDDTEVLEMESDIPRS